MLITVDLNDAADRARARELLAAADADPTETPENGCLAADVVAYVHKHAPVEQRNTMLGILAREVVERGAYLLTGGEHNKKVRLCLPGTPKPYAAVRPGMGGVRLTKPYADGSLLAHFSEYDTYPVRVRFTGPDSVNEFHRLAAIAFEHRAKAMQVYTAPTSATTR